jgi:hypothetical protein
MNDVVLTFHKEAAAVDKKILEAARGAREALSDRADDALHNKLRRR